MLAQTLTKIKIGGVAVKTGGGGSKIYCQAFTLATYRFEQNRPPTLAVDFTARLFPLQHIGLTHLDRGGGSEKPSKGEKID